MINLHRDAGISALCTNGIGRTSAGKATSPGVYGLSGDGRVALLSTTAPLVATDGNNRADTYTYDIATGAIDLVSATADGSAGNGASLPAAASFDGRYVLFLSDATILVTNDGNGALRDAFLRDRESGTTSS